MKLEEKESDRKVIEF